MTFGSEPRRRRWSPDSSRRSADRRHASEDDDAESWLAGIRPDHDDESWLTGSSPDRDDEPQPRQADRHASAGEQEPRDRIRAAGEPRSRATEPRPPVTGPRPRPAASWSPPAEPRSPAAEPPSPATGSWSPAAEPPSPATGSWSPPAEERRVRGRPRAAEPDDVPTRNGGSARARASASVPVRGAPRPPVAAPDQHDQVIQPRGRAAVSGRVSPPGSARVPPGTGGPSPVVPSAGRSVDERRPPVDDPWRRDRRGAVDDSGPVRRPTDDSGPIRRRPIDDSGPVRRPTDDSGPVRTGRRPDRPAGWSHGDYPAAAARRTPARARRDAAAGSARPRPRWQSGLLGLTSVLVLVAVAFGGYLLINGGRANSPAKRSTAGPVMKARDISSRDVDQAPLTEQEVFPGQHVAIGSSTYQVLKTQATDCQTAATGDLAKLLTDLGCSQVVRGTLRSPDSQFLVTAGIVNLKDEASANQAYETIKPTLDAQKGRFTGLSAGDGTEAMVRAPTTLGWHPRGHFLAYCVVARADGKPIAADDPDSKQVISDVVEGYLRDEVLGARATTPVNAPK